MVTQNKVEGITYHSRFNKHRKSVFIKFKHKNSDSITIFISKPSVLITESWVKIHKFTWFMMNSMHTHDSSVNVLYHPDFKTWKRCPTRIIVPIVEEEIKQQEWSWCLECLDSPLKPWSQNHSLGKDYRRQALTQSMVWSLQKQKFKHAHNFSHESCEIIPNKSNWTLIQKLQRGLIPGGGVDQCHLILSKIQKSSL